MSEPVLAFAWEPVSNKFAVIHGDSPRISVSFYAIQPKGKVEALSKCWLVRWHVVRPMGQALPAVDGYEVHVVWPMGRPYHMYLQVTY